MNRRLIVKLTIAIALAVIAPVLAQVEPDPGVWVKAPKRTGRAVGQDKIARDELLKLVEARQDAEFRKKFKVSIPNEPTGLPKVYDSLIYGGLLRIEANVRGERARLEMCTVEGIRRGAFPLEIIDRLARQLAYAHQAKQQLQDDDAFLLGGDTHRYATHVPFFRLEIISCDAADPFHLRTGAHQLLASTSIDEGTRGLPGFVETQILENLCELARRLPALNPDDELRAELVRRLSKVPKAVEKNTPFADRNDLRTVEAALYGRLAVNWRVKAAMSELRRLGLNREWDQLAIATADDPTRLLAQAIVSKDHSMFTWSLDFATSPPNPKLVGLLVGSLPLVDERRVERIMESLEDADMTAEQIEEVEKLHAAATAARTRIASARLLLHLTNRDAIYEELTADALKNRPKPNYNDPEEDARDAVLSYSAKSGKKRTESAKLARTLLDRIPANARSDATGLTPLIAHLGKLGDRDDLPRLKAYCSDDSWYLTQLAIEAMARIDASVALPLARKQIEVFNQRHEGASEYSWFVGTYLDLILWQRDAAAIRPLKTALAKYRAENPYETNWVEGTEQVIRYLEARDPNDRLAQALQYLDRDASFDADWRIDIGKQLIAEGADPRACEPLLKPPPKRKRNR